MSKRKMEIVRARNFKKRWNEARTAGKTVTEYAKELGYTEASSLLRSRRAAEVALKESLPALPTNKPGKRNTRGPADKSGFSPVELPAAGVSVDELVSRRKREFEFRRSHEEARKLITRQVPVDGPYGILHFGDPHVDDDGTDLGLLEQHALTIREVPALFGANVGDTTNNWVGRLARLYAEQGTTASQAWQLAEWFIKLVGPKWLYVIGGNHDMWSGAGDPLIWITREINALYQASEVRLQLDSKSGQSIRINAKHDFSGSSIWNPAHSVMVAAQRSQTPDDIYICGHKHKSGYQPLKADSGKIMHAIQVASYKLFDRYALEKGFRDQNISPAVVTIVDPAAKNPNQLITVFHDVDDGVDFLAWKRSRK